MLSTQEVIRVRRNIHPGLPWETTANHLNDFSKRLRLSGYNQDYRYQIIKSGVEGFEKMKDVASQGGRPINSPWMWEEDLRQKKKYFKWKTWFKKGVFDVPLFVPHTPRGELAKRMKRKEGENNQGRKIRNYFGTHGQRKIVAWSDVSHLKVTVDRPRVDAIAIERASPTPSSVKNVASK